MKNKKIREPMQSRSIDKKNKIIETAYEVFSRVGYYDANTTDIAKEAGVSTGIVYGYFKDKRDILSYVIDIYIDRVASPCMKYFSNIQEPIDIDKIIVDFVDLVTNIHKQNAKLHNILHSLTVSDEKIRQKFINLEDHITVNVTQTLQKLGFDIPNLTERVHIAMNFIQSFSHESVYDRHDYMDYDKMRQITIQMLCSLFKR